MFQFPLRADVNSVGLSGSGADNTCEDSLSKTVEPKSESVQSNQNASLFHAHKVYIDPGSSISTEILETKSSSSEISLNDEVDILKECEISIETRIQQQSEEFEVVKDQTQSENKVEEYDCVSSESGSRELTNEKLVDYDSKCEETNCIPDHVNDCSLDDKVIITGENDAHGYQTHENKEISSELSSREVISSKNELSQPKNPADDTNNTESLSQTESREADEHFPNSN